MNSNDLIRKAAQITRPAPPAAVCTLNPMANLGLGAFLAFLLFWNGAMQAADSAILIRNGQKIGFMGDSITEQAAAPSGYINLVIRALKVEGIEATALPAGVSGHTSGNMLSRLTPQILSKNADWMTLSCGVNDVGMQPKGRGVDLEGFKKNVTAMVEQALANKTQVVLLTTTPLGEDLENERNAQIAPYNEFLRSYANEKHLVLADVNEAFRKALKTPPAPDYSGDPGKRLLADGTHPNQAGQKLMAKTILLALKVPAGDFSKIEKDWMENPQGKGVKVGGGTLALISQNQYNALEKLAGEKHLTVRGIVGELWGKALAESKDVDPEKATGAAQAKIGPMVDQFIKSGNH